MSKPLVALVVAVAENGVIGNKGQLPWKQPADMKFFKELTTGGVVIMGRHTFEAIEKPLPGRTNIVVSRDVDCRKEGCTVMQNLEAAIAYAQTLPQTRDEIYIIGGGQIYAEALAKGIANVVYLTRILHSFEGDAFFPELLPDEWLFVDSRPYPADAANPYAMRFERYSHVHVHYNK